MGLYTAFSVAVSSWISQGHVPSEEEITSQLENLNRVLQKFAADPVQHDNEDEPFVFTEWILG